MPFTKKILNVLIWNNWRNKDGRENYDKAIKAAASEGIVIQSKTVVMADFS